MCDGGGPGGQLHQVFDSSAPGNLRLLSLKFVQNFG